jgi:hypothetical protein
VYYIFTENTAYLAVSKTPGSLSPGSMYSLISSKMAGSGTYNVYQRFDDVPSSIKEYFEKGAPFKSSELFIDAYVYGERMLFLFNPDSRHIRGPNQEGNVTMVYVGPFDPAEESLVKQKEIEAERLRLEAIERERKITNYLEQATTLFEGKKLYQAYSYYEEILKLDPNQSEAKTRRDELQDFFSKRNGEGYVYREQNANAFQELQVKIKTAITDHVNSSENGDLNFDVYIEFDTNGINQSRVTNLQNMDFASKLNSLLKSEILTPTSNFGVFTNSRDRIQVKASWQLVSEQVVSDAKGINSDGNAFKTRPSTYKQFIEAQAYPYGNFFFNTKSAELTLNQSKDTILSIFLTQYKLNTGPQHAFLSLLLPGWGSYKVSNGQKGILAGMTAIASLGAAGLLKVLEKMEMKEYKTAETQSQAEASYESANQIRKLFLTSLGIAGITYVYDFSWSLVKGFSNIKRSKYYRETLEKGHIKVI